jgi:hypothetical protein
VIDKLSFPDGKLPQAKPKLLPPDVFYEWVITNIRHLEASGRLERILRNPGRRPAEARFTL